MPIGFLNWALLAGLAAMIIPPLIHLLSRRRYDIVPWAAMQFLETSQRTSRRFIVDDWLLMLMRMGLIGLIVLTMANPFDRFGKLSRFLGRGTGDRVIIVDQSGSMSSRADDSSVFDSAQRAAEKIIDQSGSTGGIGIIAAQSRPEILVNLSKDRGTARAAIEQLARPRGIGDGPAAVASAIRSLAEGARAHREITVLTDGQRFGWADPSSLAKWEMAATQAGTNRPRLRIVNLASARNADDTNWSITPLKINRPLATVGQEVTIRATLRRQGPSAPLPALQLEVDGRAEGGLTPPAAGNEAAEAEFTVRYRFRKPGSHLLMVKTSIADSLPIDDRQDLAMEVLPVLPVAIVESDTSSGTVRRPASFLRDALAPSRDPNPSIIVRTVQLREFDDAFLNADIAGPETKPRVLILVDLPRLAPAQSEAVAKFIDRGGSVLIALGDRPDAEFYNREFFRGGKGWLPAELSGLPASEVDPNTAPRPDPKSFLHPAFEMFREPLPGGFHEVRIPRYWKLNIGNDGRTTVAARLSDGSPLFVEKAVGNGRVMASAIPLDNRWKTNLIELPAFAVLAHELVYYLAGSRLADGNLASGQPISFPIPASLPATGWTIETPGGSTQSIEPRDRTIRWTDTIEPGVYQIRQGDQIARYFVVAKDPRESDLTPMDEADRMKLQAIWPGLEFTIDPLAPMTESPESADPVDLWWLPLLGVIGLLLTEVWWTRQRAQAAMS